MKSLNIMLLVGEDTGRHHGCYGNAYAHTPNIDRLAGQGVRYTNAFTHSPVCAPSRSGMITGQYPWAMGTHLMRCTLNQPPRLFTHELIDAGVEVHWPTKTDFNFDPLAHSIGQFAIHKRNWIDDGTIPAGRFFLYHNFRITHESSPWDTPNWLGEVYADRIKGVPPEVLHDPTAAPVPPYLPDDPRVRRDVARYHDMLRLQDQAIGRALDLLEQSGRADDTIVIYLSDHGRGLPREKRHCYDAGLHLPLIIRWSGVIEPGSVCDELVGWVDIAPTILSLMKVAVPDGYHGQVFLGPHKAPPREYVFAGRDRMDEAFDKVRVCRSKRYHFIRNDAPAIPWMQRQGYMEQGPSVQALREWHAAGTLDAVQQSFMQPTKPAEELYDLNTDPHTMINVIDDPRHRASLDEHRAALNALLASTGDLGETTEEELISEGIIADSLTQCRKQVAALQTAHRIGPELGPVTLADYRKLTGA